MPLDAATFEKLGAFYLGRAVDPGASEPTDEPLLYDSRDLVTHAVCVGMTGSGKTGLGVALLEEAAIDGVPAIVIDPKGDLTNLALQFPELRPTDFAPWLAAGEAAREGLTPEAFSSRQADTWRNGLARWGQDGERIRRLAGAAEVAIYTPGSTAGRSLSVLASFDAPAAEITADGELLAERVQSTASALLSLAGIADDATGREQTLVSTILAEAWRAGESLSLAEVVRRIHRPPFASVGMLDVETFYPEKERFQLVLALNNLLASPAFQAWQQGDPLDVGRLLFTSTGRPRLAVLSIAHLGDAERMFFVALLLNAVVSWMRAQSGTTSLRALLYMDEVFGFFPPVANPPSKRPLLTLLKQARAFGLGVVLSTQNPADLDYKGLANAGTWWIGRLQTERDRARLLDGLGQAGATDREALEVLLSDLGKRRFVMKNVHEPAPVLFETRWTLSFLAGPLTRDQIRALRKPPEPAVAGVSPAPSSLVTPESGPPVLKGVPQLYARARSGEVWTPGVLVGATVSCRDSRRGIDVTHEECWLAPLSDLGPDWSAGAEARTGDFSEEGPSGSFAPLPAAARNAKNFAAWKRDATDWLAANRGVEVFRCPELKLESRPDESEGAFRVRVAHALRERRDDEVAKVRAAFDRKLTMVRTRRQRAMDAVAREEAQAGQARLQTMLSVGSTLLGAFLGRKAVSASTLGRATTAAKGIGRSMKEAGDVGTARERLAAAEAELAMIEEEAAAEVAALATRTAEPTVEKVRVAPSRGGVRISVFALAWS